MIYLTVPVLTEDPNRRDIPTHILLRSKTRMDSTTGAFSEIVRSPAQQQVRPFSWFMGTRADIVAFQTFRDARQGRLSPFWIPTWHNDFYLLTDVNAGSTSILIQNIGYTRYLFDPVKTYRRYLAFIQIGTGVSFIRKILTTTEDSPAQETIGLDAGVPVDMTNGQWMLSFLSYCRLEEDTITTHFHLPTLAEAVLTVRELPQEMP